MNLKVVFYSLLLVSFQATAQVAPGGAANQGQAKLVDLSKPGAPMPPLKMFTGWDTTGAAARNASAATTGTNEQPRRKRRHRHKKDSTAPQGKPNFLYNADFDNGANLFVMIFNPNCSHCQDETQQLLANVFLFNKSKVAMLVNPVMSPYLPSFVQSFHIAEYPTFSIGVDSSGFIDKVFLYSMLPQISVYDKNRHLIRSFTGETPVDTLKQYIQ